MIRFATVVSRFSDLPPGELTDWIARGWIHAQPAPEGDWIFAEIDVARVGLIHDLRRAMALDDETVPLVLGLLDQVYDLRRTLRSVADALDEQSDTVRERLRQRLLGLL